MSYFRHLILHQGFVYKLRNIKNQHFKKTLSLAKEFEIKILNGRYCNPNLPPRAHCNF